MLQSLYRRLEILVVLLEGLVVVEAEGDAEEEGMMKMMTVT